MNHKSNGWNWQVTEELHHQRLDKVLATLKEEWSRSKVQQWIQEGYVQVEGRIVKSNYRLNEGESITVTLPDVAEGPLKSEAIPLDIRYEDEYLLVVNKPRGMVVHPGAGNREGTMVNALLHHLKGQLSNVGGVERPGIVHRIDKDTSGLLVVAKTDQTHHLLAEQLRAREMKRIYWAIVQGILSHDIGTIDAPIG